MRFCLRLARSEYDISHVPGKLLVTADGLSWTLLLSVPPETSLQKEAEYLMETCIAALPASCHRLEEFNAAQAAYTDCSTLFDYCCNDWPEKWNIPIEVKPFWQSRGLLKIHIDLLLYGPRIVIAASLQRQLLSKKLMMDTKTFKNVAFDLMNRCGGVSDCKAHQGSC